MAKYFVCPTEGGIGKKPGCGKPILKQNPANRNSWLRADGQPGAQAPGGVCYHCGEQYDLLVSGDEWIKELESDGEKAHRLAKEKMQAEVLADLVNAGIVPASAMEKAAEVMAQVPDESNKELVKKDDVALPDEEEEEEEEEEVTKSETVVIEKPEKKVEKKPKSKPKKKKEPEPVIEEPDIEEEDDADDEEELGGAFG
jgi:hypothetical protein